MSFPIPINLKDYCISEKYGFLPDDFPLQKLPHDYYSRWEDVVGNLQALILSQRLRHLVRQLPVLSTSYLETPAEWRRAYVVLAIIVHAYIWGGDAPEERVPASVSIPFLEITKYLELPPVATYAGTVLWNFKPLALEDPIDNLENLSTLNTFTGSRDESWFYLVSIAIEARGARLIPLMLNAMQAVRRNDEKSSKIVTASLQETAEGIDELGSLLVRMYENCDPHIFYHRIRPFLAGSKNMADAGLPNGVIFDTGSGKEGYEQWGGASATQSSLIQFFDIVLGITHRPTGHGPPSSESLSVHHSSSTSPVVSATMEEQTASSDTLFAATAASAISSLLSPLRSTFPSSPSSSSLESSSNSSPISSRTSSFRSSPDSSLTSSPIFSPKSSPACENNPITPPPKSNNFIHEMRSYMPGPHARFLRDVSAAANIRPYVASRSEDQALILAFNDCLAMLRELRNKHIRIVTRYIITKSHEARQNSDLEPESPQIRRKDIDSSSAGGRKKKINLATGTSEAVEKQVSHDGAGTKNGAAKKPLASDGSEAGGSHRPRGTGGTSLIPFLKQARDETSEGTIEI